jgi:hypothetical protein
LTKNQFIDSHGKKVEQIFSFLAPNFLGAGKKGGLSENGHIGNGHI